VIEPTEKDVGRRVMYKPYWQSPHPSDPVEYGKITSFNDQFVFVRYDGVGETSMGTFRSLLFWERELS